MNKGHDFAKILGGENAGGISQPEVTDLTSNEGAPQPQQTTNDDAPVADSGDGSSSDIESSLNSGTETPPASERGFDEGEVLSYLSEKLGRSVDSFDSLTQQPESKGVEFASEQLKALNDYVSETGRGVEDYFKAQSMDTENMSSEDLLKSYIGYNNPDYSQKEVDLYFNHLYKQDSDKYDEEETALGSLQMKRDVREAKKLFQEVKDNYYSKESGSNEMSEQEAKEVRSNWINNMESQVDELEGISFDINDSGEEFTFAITDEARAGLKDSNSNLDSFFNKYVSDDGSWDYDQLNQDMFILNNIQDIVRGVANQYRSKGTEQVIKDAKNINMSPKSQPTSSNSKSIGSQIADEIFKNSTRWNK